MSYQTFEQRRLARYIEQQRRKDAAFAATPAGRSKRVRDLMVRDDAHDDSIMSGLSRVAAIYGREAYVGTRDAFARKPTTAANGLSEGRTE